MRKQYIIWLFVIIVLLFLWVINNPNVLSQNRITSTIPPNTLQADESKLVGTWELNTAIAKQTIVFNSDKSGMYTSNFGDKFFDWKISNNKIIMYDRGVPDEIPYRFYGNDRLMITLEGMEFTYNRK